MDGSRGWTPIAIVKQKGVKKQFSGTQKLSIYLEGKDSMRSMEARKRRFTKSVVSCAAKWEESERTTDRPKGKGKSSKRWGKSKGKNKKKHGRGR